MTTVVDYTGRLWTCVAVMATIALVLLVGCSGPAPGSNAWPASSVRLVTPNAAGGGPDLVARTLATALAERWKKPVVVDNRPGADGIVAVRAIIDANDDHMLLFAPSSILAVNPVVRESLPYRVEDLAVISPVVDVPIAMVVGPAVTAASLDEFMAEVRSRPGALTYTTVFGAPQVLWQAFQQQHGLEMPLVGYRNPNVVIPDLTERRVHLALLPLGTVLGQVRTGTVRLLAIMSRQRSSVAPDVPTASEAGFAELTIEGGLGVFGLATMPAARRDWVASEIATALADPVVARRLSEAGFDALTYTPDEYSAVLSRQRHRFTAIVRGEPADQ